jgi:DNA primase
MATWVDFDEIKAKVSLEQVLRHYNLLDSMTQKGKRMSGLCPFHPDSATKSFKADLEKNLWNCFGACNRGGDLIDLVCIAEGIDTGNRTSARRQAALLLQEWFEIVPSASTQAKTTTRRKPRHRTKTGGAGDSPSAADTEHQEEATTAAEAATSQEQPASDLEEPAPNEPLTFTFRRLDPMHPYLVEQGLSEETIATFGLGYHAGRGMMHGRIVIPIHDEQGQLIAYAGRWPGDDPPEDEPKYIFPPNFHKSLVLYNLHLAREHAGDGLIVCEGFFSGVFTLWQLGRKNVVAVMGSSLSEAQERLIVQTVGPRGRVLLAFDDDAAGRKGMAEAAARLAPQVFVRTRALR